MDPDSPLDHGTLQEIVTHLLTRIGSPSTAITGLHDTDLFLFAFLDVATPMELFECVTDTLKSCPKKEKSSHMSQVCQFLFSWFSKHMTRDIKYNKPLLDLAVAFVMEIEDTNERSRLSELFHTSKSLRRFSSTSPSNAKKLLPTASFVAPQLLPSNLSAPLSFPSTLSAPLSFRKNRRSPSSAQIDLSQVPLTARGERKPQERAVRPLSSSGSYTLEFPHGEQSDLTVRRRCDSSTPPPRRPPPTTPPTSSTPSPVLLVAPTSKKSLRTSSPTSHSPLLRQTQKHSPLFMPVGGEESTARIFMHYSISKVTSTLTGLVWTVFREIQSSELLSCAWTKPDASETAPNVVKLTTLFNRITFFVSLEILFAPSSETTHAITFYIKVARDLKKVCDLQSMYAVVAALTSLPVSRLKNAWAQVDEKYLKSFAKLQSATSQEKNAANLRKLYNNAPAPKIPALPLLQKEVFLCYENDLFNDKEKKIINFGVLLMIGGRLKNLEEQQEMADFRSAHLVYSHSLNHFFSVLRPNLSEDELYQRSLVLFPIGAKVDEEGPSSHTHHRIGLSDRNMSIDANLLLATYETLKDAKDEEEEEEEEDTREKKKLKHWRSVSQKNMRRVSVTVSNFHGVQKP